MSEDVRGWGQGRRGVVGAKPSYRALAAAMLLALLVSADSAHGSSGGASDVLRRALRLDGTQLDLRGTDVTDADLEGLSDPAFANVTSVLLARTAITDAGIRNLHGLEIELLDLYGTAITDAGLSHLAGLPLEQLDLTGTSVTDEGLVHLSELPLVRLTLRDTAVTGAGLAELDEPAIAFLDLSFSRITSSGVAVIAGWKRLEIVDLSGTSISDEGLLLLLDSPSLSQLNVSDTAVTLEAIRRFEARRPAVRVVSEAPVR